MFLLACAAPDPVAAEVFRAADDVRSLDGGHGLVRVHYSDRGPNSVDKSDDDDDGLPDRAQDAAWLAEDVLGLTTFWGLAGPVPEAEVGIPGRGGSDALDLYLTASVGEDWDQTEQEACVGRRCADSIRLPADDDTWLDDLVAHQVFHAIQDAYDATEPRWLRESTALHAEVEYRGFPADFQSYLDVADCGLADIEGLGRCGRGVDGTAVLWQYLSDAVGPDVAWRVIEATAEVDGVDAVEAGLAAEGTSLVAEWPGFAAANLATGPREGEDGYGSTNQITGIRASAEGETIYDTRTFAPLSARYYRVDHAGGELWLGASGHTAGLQVTAHPVADGGADGPLGATFGPFAVPAESAILLGDLDAGGVWLSVSHADPTEGAATVTLCVGAEADADPCVAPAEGCNAGGGAPTIALLLLVGRRRYKPGPPNNT